MNSKLVTPNVLSFTTVIAVWANSGRVNSACRARDLLRRCVSLHDAGDKDLAPDTIIFNAVLNAWSKAAAKGEKGAADGAEELLEEMVRLSRSAEDLYVRPDGRSYNLVLGTIARERGGIEAERFLESMHQARSSGDTNVPLPDVTSFNVVIDAFASVGDAGRAVAVLEKMEAGVWDRLADDGGEDALPRPTTRTYTSVLDALSKSNQLDAGDLAEAILCRMSEMRAVSDGGSEKMRPDTRAYNAVIRCYANAGGSRGREAALRSEGVLDNMEKRYAETGDESVRPDAYTYSSVITAWSKSDAGEEGGRRAEAVLERMIEGAGDIYPSPHSFNAAIAAWGRSGTRGSAQKAERLLRRMDGLYEEGNQNLKPNVFTFTSVRIYFWIRTFKLGLPNRFSLWDLLKSNTWTMAALTFSPLLPHTR